MTENNKFCPTCGTRAAGEAVFCQSCGVKFPTTDLPRPVPAPVLPQAPRSDFISLSCPNCGGKLTITSDVERFTCQFCGHEHIVRRSGGLVALEPVLKNINAGLNRVGEGMNQLGLNSEKQAAEQTISRLTKEVDELDKKVIQLGGDRIGHIGASLSMIALGVGMMIASAVMGWPGWVYLICLAFIAPFLIWFITALKGVEKQKIAKQQLAEKRAQLEQLYQFVSPLNRQ
jgi:ribosomal protein S27E/cell division protein FtsB